MKELGPRKIILGMKINRDISYTEKLVEKFSMEFANQSPSH